jgi:hypothetical protein
MPLFEHVSKISKWPLLFLPISFSTVEAEWTSFQTHCFSEYLVTPGIEPDNSQSAARNSGH